MGFSIESLRRLLDATYSLDSTLQSCIGQTCRVEQTSRVLGKPAVPVFAYVHPDANISSLPT